MKARVKNLCVWALYEAGQLKCWEAKTLRTFFYGHMLSLFSIFKAFAFLLLWHCWQRRGPPSRPSCLTPNSTSAPGLWGLTKTKGLCEQWTRFTPQKSQCRITSDLFQPLVYVTARWRLTPERVYNGLNEASFSRNELHDPLWWQSIYHFALQTPRRRRQRSLSDRRFTNQKMFRLPLRGFERLSSSRPPTEARRETLLYSLYF